MYLFTHVFDLCSEVTSVFDLQVCSFSCVRTNVVKLSPATYTNTVMSNCTEATNSEEGAGNLQMSLPEEPTTCCMSGCTNCVWIQYAEEVSKFYADGGEKAREIILSKVTDPNTRAFLMMELKSLGQKSS